MENRWSDVEAAAIVADHRARGINEDIALRVYTSRLIGVEPGLVIHGGGNTSVKTRVPDFFGDQKEVICVKGSGWDLAKIEAPGLPAVELEPLRRTRTRNVLSDEDMVSLFRLNLLNISSPNPSVETLLHAFLPQKFIDHSHASAILALTDQPRGNALCRKVFGDRLAIVPYVMPGFNLAKATADAYEAAPECEGVLLEKHGLFTFGETARESYDRMIAFVSAAEDAISAAPDWIPAPRCFEPPGATPEDIAPIIRGLTADDLGGGDYNRFIIDFRTSTAIRAFVDGADLADYGGRGVVTPDHIIRTKNHYLIAPVPAAGDLQGFADGLRGAVATYRSSYDKYFSENNVRVGETKTKLDSAPRVILVPGVGVFGLGRTPQDAQIVADLAEITLDTISRAERIGTFEPLPSDDLFDMEYWSLEQSKLHRATPKPFAGQVAVVTGGGGAIGAATARSFALMGACVVALDLDQSAAASVAMDIGKAGGTCVGLACDVTDSESVATAFKAICGQFGGVDILVSNAGAAYESGIADMEDALLRKSFEINFFAHQRVAQAAFSIMRRQETGGALLFNVSKQAVNPGANFGAYGLPKASTLFLVRQYALEGGRHGIRANAVNADRIRSGLLTDDLIRRRAAARGLETENYLTSNLLGREVVPSDVAQAFVHHALALKTTGDVTTVDGGNVAAMLR